MDLAMKTNYTFSDLIKDVFLKEKSPLSADEIWRCAQNMGLDEKIGTTGKTPAATIGARLYTSMKQEGDASPYEQVSSRPAVFVLKECSCAPKSVEVNVETAPAKRAFNERDLHPLLASYVNSNPHFHCKVKTIFHENSNKKMKGVNKWLHPDLVGVYFPFEDFEPEALKLQKSLDVSSIKLYSFEMKIQVDFSNLRECYFQAVSNSSWANEGYLVCLDMDESPEFKNELQRLSSAFGIGVIKLGKEYTEESEIVCPARCTETVDWNTLNRLVEESPDFKNFIRDIMDDISVSKIKSQYDEVKSPDAMQLYLKQKNII